MSNPVLSHYHFSFLSGSLAPEMGELGVDDPRSVAAHLHQNVIDSLIRARDYLYDHQEYSSITVDADAFTAYEFEVTWSETPLEDLYSTDTPEDIPSLFESIKQNPSQWSYTPHLRVTKTGEVTLFGTAAYMGHGEVRFEAKIGNVNDIIAGEVFAIDSLGDSVDVTPHSLKKTRRRRAETEFER
jgi:hypothetical protein